MKRILAFLLAASMLLGNTTTAFATTVDNMPISEITSDGNGELSQDVPIFENGDNENGDLEGSDSEELEQGEPGIVECQSEERIVVEEQYATTKMVGLLQAGTENRVEISNVYIEQDFKYEYICINWEVDYESAKDSNMAFFRLYMSDSADGNYEVLGVADIDDRYCWVSTDSVGLDQTTGKNIIKYFKIVPVYYRLDSEGERIELEDGSYEYVEGDDYGIFSSREGYYSSNTQNSNGPFNDEKPNPYIGICFMEKTESGEYSKLDSLELHMGECKQIVLGLIDKKGIITPVPTEKDFENLMDGSDFWLHSSATWETWEYGAEVADEDYKYIKREFTADMAEDFSAYFTGTQITGEKNYFLQFERNLEIGWYYERIPLKVLEAEEGVEYEQAPILQVATTAKEFNAIVREKMKNRDYSSFATLISEENVNIYDVFDFYQERADMEPDEGDYLHYTAGGAITSSVFYDHFEKTGSIEIDGEDYNLYKIGVPFITTRAQEDEVDEAIEKLFAPGGELSGLEEKTDKEKVEAIFKFVKKVKSSTGDRTKPILHTAYNALINGNGTCQAYALLFTRLTREIGIASKVIMGTDANAHTYNIVDINGKWYYIDCSSGIGLSTATQFKRTKEQEKYKDQRFINNYLCKVVGNNETYIAEPGVSITNNLNETEAIFERNADITNVLSVAREYVLTDSKLGGNQSKEYKITLTANVFVDWVSEETLDFGECADRVEIDLDNHSLIVKDYMGLELCAAKVSNGTIVVGKDASVTINHYDNNSNSSYSNLNFVYEQSEKGIDYGEYADGSVWFENSGATSGSNAGTIQIANDVTFEGLLDVKLGNKVCSKADMDVLFVGFCNDSISEGSIKTKNCRFEGNTTVNNLEVYEWTEFYTNAENIHVYGNLSLGNCTDLYGTEPVKLYLLKEYCSLDSEEAEREGKVSFSGVFAVYDIKDGKSCFELIPMIKIGDEDAKEIVYTARNHIASIKNVTMNDFLSEEKVTVTQSNLREFITCRLDENLDGLEIELNEGELIATVPSIIVTIEENEFGKFSSLENALAAINTQKEPLEGQYVFAFTRDTSISTDITLPVFMKEPVFKAMETEFLEEIIIPEVTLDLKGHKLNVTQNLVVESGLNIIDSVGGAVVYSPKSYIDFVYVEGYSGNATINVKIEANTVIVDMEAEPTTENKWELKEVIVTNTFRNEENSRASIDSLTINSGIFISEENSVVHIGSVKKIANVQLKADSYVIVDDFVQNSKNNITLWAGSKFVVNESATIYNAIIEPIAIFSDDGEIVDYIRDAHIYKMPAASIKILGKVTSYEDSKLSFGLLSDKATASELPTLKDFDTQVALFDTTIAAKNLSLSLFTVEQASEDSDSNYNAVFRTENTIYVGKEWFTVKQSDGANEETLESFAKWSDAVAYINKLKNKNAAYIIEISESLDLNEALTMPTTLSSLTVRGKDNFDGISITYVGDVKLTVPTTFENLQFSAKKYNSKTKVYDSYISVLNLNNKNVTLKNCDGTFASVTTGTKSLVTLVDTNMNVAKAVTVKDLVMGKAQFSTDSLTVSNLLTMESAEIICKNKITLKDIKTEDGNNILSYAENSTKKNTLVINGTISAENLGTTEISGRTFRQNAFTLQMKKADGTDVEFGQDTFLCKAPKAGAGWFKVNSESEISGTYKKEDFIYCGNAVENVKLYSSVDGQEDYIWESSFATLNEALAEIDKLGIAAQHYKVELADSTENADENVFSSKKSALASPSKAVSVIITTAADEPMSIYFKGNLTLKTNTVLENIILEPAAKYSISLGNFALTLDNCTRNESLLLSGISGSGVAKNSALYLIDTNLRVNGAMNNVGKIGFDGDSSLTSEGKVNIGDIILYKAGYLTGLASVTRKKGVVTKVASQITINGQVYDKDPSGVPVLYLDYLESVSKQYTEFSFEKAQNILDAGFDAAKALKVNYERIQLKQLKETDKNHNLIKSKGNLLYFNGTPTVLLSYKEKLEDTEEVISYCRNFADAVTDINNQKTKRAYTIKLLEDIGMDTPSALTMPNKNYITGLIIDGAHNSIGYLGNLSLTSDVELRNIQFVQMQKVGSAYVSSDIAKAYHPSAVSVTTSYGIDVVGAVTFNTPLNLNGSKKGTLTLSEAGKLYTVTNSYNNPNIIVGNISNFEEVTLDNYSLDVVPFNTNVNKPKYTVPSVSITNLNISTGELSVEGKLNLANVSMAGLNPTIAATLDFNITGTLNVESDTAKLSTYAKAVNKEPYLKVTGNVIRGDEYEPVEIEIFENETEHRSLTCGTDAKSTLLTVKNAQAYHFKPHNENVNLGGDYMLVKSGAKICLNTMDNAAVYLYEGALSDEKWRGAYLTYGEATTAIDAINNKTAEYTYVLVKEIGELSKPVSVTIPSKAAKVVVQSTEAVVPEKLTVYVKGSITLKTDTEFKNIKFAPVNKSKGTTMNIAAGNFDLTLTDVEMLDETTMSIKDITGAGKQTIILDSANLVINGKINKADRIVVRKNATANGTVTTNYLQYDGDVQLILNGRNNNIKYPIENNY